MRRIDELHLSYPFAGSRMLRGLLGLCKEFGHPEIIIFGLAEETMHRLVNDVGEQVRNGVRYSAGDQTSDLLKGYTCVFGTVISGSR
jgi:Domain of unknown function (DUF4262)